MMSLVRTSLVSLQAANPLLTSPRIGGRESFQRLTVQNSLPRGGGGLGWGFAAQSSKSVSQSARSPRNPRNYSASAWYTKLNRTPMAGACPWAGLQPDPGADHDGWCKRFKPDSSGITLVRPLSGSPMSGHLPGRLVSARLTVWAAAQGRYGRSNSDGRAPAHRAV